MAIDGLSLALPTFMQVVRLWVEPTEDRLEAFDRSSQRRRHGIARSDTCRLADEA